MAFEFRDKTEDYVQFIKDGQGIQYTGNFLRKLLFFFSILLKLKICLPLYELDVKQTLIGVRNLAEYEILVEDLNITTSQNNHSLALVKVVFRRQGGFHLLTSFVS